MGEKTEQPISDSDGETQIFAKSASHHLPRSVAHRHEQSTEQPLEQDARERDAEE